MSKVANYGLIILTAKTTFAVGFIRLLRQWAGRTAKLVSSSTELRTPSQGLSNLDSPLPTHPTQGSVPFSAQCWVL